MWIITNEYEDIHCGKQEKRKFIMYFYNVCAIIENKPLVGDSLMKSLFNNLKDMLLEFIEVKSHTVSVGT